VTRAKTAALVIADMPFMSYQVSAEQAVLNAGRLVQEGGADAVKLEGGERVAAAIERITAAGIPVMGHLGLTPQSVNALAGFRVQGRSEDAAERIVGDAKRLEELGCFSIVLECVPSALGKRITEAVGIPTIGVGAGLHCDGQVLVLNDLLGLTGGHRPRFVRTYLDGATAVREAVDRFDRDVKQGAFPTAAESYEA